MNNLKNDFKKRICVLRIGKESINISWNEMADVFYLLGSAMIHMNESGVRLMDNNGIELLPFKFNDKLINA